MTALGAIEIGYPKSTQNANKNNAHYQLIQSYTDGNDSRKSNSEKSPR